jgi:hypothetical protein
MGTNRLFKVGIRARESGIEPESELFAMLRYVKVVEALRSGMLPLSLLFSK